MWDKWSGKLPIIAIALLLALQFAEMWNAQGTQRIVALLLVSLMSGVVVVFFHAIGWITLRLVGRFLDRRKAAKLISTALDAGVIDEDFAHLLRGFAFSTVRFMFSKYIRENEKGDPAALLREWRM